MPSRYRRPQVSRARQRAMLRRRRLYTALAALGLVLVAAVIIGVVRRGGGQDRQVSAPMPTLPPVEAIEETEAPDPTPEPVQAVPAARFGDLEEEGSVVLYDTPQPTAAPTPTPAPASAPAGDSSRAQTRPTPTAEGFVPVFSKAIDTEEHIVAITIDDCFQGENLRKIVETAKEYGGKLTIFPIGENVLRDPQSQILKDAWENGFELENHTYTHNGLYKVSDQRMTEEVYKQQLTLSHILGLEYHCHFLRPMGGDARRDQRMQMYAKQLGYYGIAHWSCAGSTSSEEKIKENLKPGAIYLFHTTNNDWDKLKWFIPWVAEQGYQMVTLNEMFDYPDNETAELTMPAQDYPIPPLEPYTRVYTPLKKTTYSWYAYQFQQKLIEVGYLEGEPDGIYGAGCVAAVEKYQRDHGMTVDGIASPELQMELLGPG